MIFPSISFIWVFLIRENEIHISGIRIEKCLFLYIILINVSPVGRDLKISWHDFCYCLLPISHLNRWFYCCQNELIRLAWLWGRWFSIWFSVVGVVLVDPWCDIHRTQFLPAIIKRDLFKYCVCPMPADLMTIYE